MVDLAIDIGQSQARIRAIHSNNSHQEIEIEGLTYGSHLLDTISHIAEKATKSLNHNTINAVAVGSTGLFGHVPPIDDILSRLNHSLGTTAVTVADDAVTAYLGARGNHNGVVVAAGTGIVGLANGPAGAARVDGVGGMIGDEGSGWWIGRQGLIAAISAADGRRNASTILLSRLEKRFGPVSNFPARLAAETSPIAIVASFAKDVADAAREGDTIAAAIWQQAGNHIANVIMAAASRAGLNDNTQWTLIGRLSGATDLLKPGLNTQLDALLPGNSQTPAIGEPLDGAARLLTIDASSYMPMVRTTRIH